MTGTTEWKPAQPLAAGLGPRPVAPAQPAPAPTTPAGWGQDALTLQAAPAPGLAPAVPEATAPAAAQEESKWAKIAATLLRESIISSGMRRFQEMEERIRSRRHGD